VLPTLVDRIEAIAVGIENARGIVARIVIQARAGLAIIGRASPHRCIVERIHLGLALGDKADMCRPGVRIALSQPEENATVSSKALEVGMSFGAILTVVIDGMHDTERLESRLVKGNRSIEILTVMKTWSSKSSPHWLADFYPDRHSAADSTGKRLFEDSLILLFGLRSGSRPHQSRCRPQTIAAQARFSLWNPRWTRRSITCILLQETRQTL
jgi:hypothetical protein